VNFVCLTPHFPANFRLFWANLRRLGVNVLGVAEEPYDALPPDVKTFLSGYFQVRNLHEKQDLVRALGYFTYQFGKLDRIESHNEYWLETEALMRLNFNIPGLKPDQMREVKQKSAMKERFRKARIPVARGQVCQTLAEGQALVEEVGFPIVAKPDNGVGANNTYKLLDMTMLQDFFATKPPIDYILEEYITGTIHTYDGLVDGDGRIVFESSLVYNEGVMELVNERRDFCYYTQREIPKALVTAGRRLVQVYGLRERFFHIEFFYTPEGKYVGLEINVRPPGGLTVDMWNYANNIDMYQQYANVVVNNRFEALANFPYYCGYISRRWTKQYRHTPSEISEAFPDHIVGADAISGIFSAALGDFGYLVRSPYIEEIFEIANFIQQED
jgi:hypothetical protein